METYKTILKNAKESIVMDLVHNTDEVKEIISLQDLNDIISARCIAKLNYSAFNTFLQAILEKHMEVMYLVPTESSPVSGIVSRGSTKKKFKTAPSVFGCTEAFDSPADYFVKLERILVALKEELPCVDGVYSYNNVQFDLTVGYAEGSRLHNYIDEYYSNGMIQGVDLRGVLVSPSLHSDGELVFTPLFHDEVKGDVSEALEAILNDYFNYL